MAITRIGSPDSNINPAYNPLVYYFDSDKKTEDAFRYVVEVFEAGTTNKLFEKTIIPDFDDQKCVCNLNREMSDFLSYHLDFDELDGDNYRATDAYYRFDLDIGEEYIEQWQWDDFGFAGSVNWPNFSDPQYNPNSLSRTMLFTTDALNQPPYTSGDTIFVELNAGTQDRPSVRGVHKVLDVYQQSSGGVEWVVVLELLWVGSGTSTGGKTKYADFRKSRFTNLLSLNNECVINTALSKIDFLNYDSTIYNMVASTGDKKFLTQMYDSYKVREGNTFFLQYMSYKTSTISTPRSIKFENDSGDSSTLSLTTSVNVGVWGIDLSPTRTDWGLVDTGTLPIIKPTTKTYSATLLDINGNAISEKKTVLIDRECVNKGSIEMLFMDKFGSFLPWNFTFRNVQDQQLEKSNYSKYLGGYQSQEGGGKFTYNLKNGGRETHNSEYKKNYLLRTEWLSDQEAEFFPNVIHSPVTMIKVNGVFQRCVVNTSSFEVKDDNWNTLKRYEITVKLSNDEIINI